MVKGGCYPLPLLSVKTIMDNACSHCLTSMMLLNGTFSNSKTWISMAYYSTLAFSELCGQIPIHFEYTPPTIQGNSLLAAFKCFPAFLSPCLRSQFPSF